jgi:hypothetical protein
MLMLTRRGLAHSAAMAAIVATTAGAIPAIAKNKAEWPSLLEAKDIAEEGFIYGLPLVMNYAVMQEFAVDKNSGQFKATFNEINNMHHVATPADTAIITPNSDTPYSFIWLDLRAEPMVISVPASRRTATIRSSLSTATPTILAISVRVPLGPSRAIIWWSVPTGKAKRRPGSRKSSDRRRRSRSRLIRTQLFNPDDMPNVEKIQAGYKAQPLSAFLKQPAPPAAPKIAFVPATTAGIKDNFFEYLDAALQFVPETSRDKAVRAKLAKIGIGPGKTFEFKDLSLEHKAEILVGHEAG